MTRRTLSIPRLAALLAGLTLVLGWRSVDPPFDHGHSGLAAVLDELRAQAVAARERIRDLERAAQEGDLAMGSVRKKLEQHLARARAEVKRLTEG